MRGRITKPPAERTPRPPERTVVSSGPGANEAQQMFATGVHGAQQRWEGGGAAQGWGAGRTRASNTAPHLGLCAHPACGRRCPCSTGCFPAWPRSPHGRPGAWCTCGGEAPPERRCATAASRRTQLTRTTRACPVPWRCQPPPRFPRTSEVVRTRVWPHAPSARRDNSRASLQPRVASQRLAIGRRRSCFAWEYVSFHTCWRGARSPVAGSVGACVWATSGGST